MAVSSAALNGTDSSAKYQSVYLEFWQVSQSIANNQTTFGYKAYMKSNVSGASGYTGYGHYTFTGATSIVKVTGQNWTWNYVRSDLIKDGTFTITHNQDGTLANQTLTVTAGGSATLGYATVSVTLPVATIPRATQPTVNYSSRDMGLAISIGVSGVATFSHNLYYSFTGVAKTFITTVTAGTTSYSWTIPLDGVNGLAQKIPNSTSGTVTITVDTVSGTTVIGTKTVTFTATVPASAIPTIPTKTATEAVAGLAMQFGAFIQGKSKLSLEMASSGVYGSSISSQLITANGQTFSAFNGIKFTGTTGFLNTVGANTITYKATDSRGRSATATLNVTVLAYTAPQITVFNVERVNGSGVADPTGTAVKATYAITVASLNSKNTKTYTLKYKTSTASTYTSVALDASSYTPNTSIIPAVTFSTSYIYNFELVANDYFGSTTVTGTVNSGFVPMHFRAGGKGIGIGMRATKDALQIGLPTEFSQEPTINGIPLLADLTTLTNQVPAAIGLTTVINKNQYYPIVEDNTGMIVGRRLLSVMSFWDETDWTEANSVGFGESALENNTGVSSNGFGHSALINNTGAVSNGFGNGALENNTGNNSSGFGFYALANNTGWGSNGFGYFALYESTGGNANGFGDSALASNTGNYANGFGSSSLYYNTGDYASGFGESALFHNIGVNNSAFGYYANSVNDPTINALTNTTCLGANTVPNRSNQVVLGDTSVDTIKMGGTARKPASGTAPGVKGETCWDTNYFYICVATNTWKCIPLQVL